MLFALFCYNSEEIVGAWSKEEDASVMAKLAAVNERLIGEKKMGPVVRLMPTTTATTLRKTGKNRRLEAGDEPPLVLDGPFAETKEQLLWILRCRMREPRRGARRRPRARRGKPGRGLRGPADRLLPARGERGVIDPAWIDLALRSARPRALAALLRYFGDLDSAEEAFQEACVRGPEAARSGRDHPVTPPP